MDGRKREMESNNNHDLGENRLTCCLPYAFSPYLTSRHFTSLRIILHLFSFTSSLFNTSPLFSFTYHFISSRKASYLSSLPYTHFLPFLFFLATFIRGKKKNTVLVCLLHQTLTFFTSSLINLQWDGKEHIFLISLSPSSCLRHTQFIAFLPCNVSIITKSTACA